MKSLRKYVALGVALVWITASTAPAYAQAQGGASAKSEQEKMAALRTALANTFNALNVMSDKEWSETIRSAADQMRARGQKQQAEAAETFSDPTMKPILLKQLQAKMNDASQNGLFFFFCLFASPTLCLATYDSPYSTVYNFVIIFFWFLTWSDEGAVNY